MKRTGPRIPHRRGPSTVEARALVLNAIFKQRSDWPAGVARPTLPQIRAVLLANRAIDHAHDARAAAFAAEQASVTPTTDSGSTETDQERIERIVAKLTTETDDAPNRAAIRTMVTNYVEQTRASEPVDETAEEV